jgi:hypothetical protein
MHGEYRYASLNDGDTFREMRRCAKVIDCIVCNSTRKPVPTHPRQRQVAVKPGKYPMLCIQF